MGYCHATGRPCNDRSTGSVLLHASPLSRPPLLRRSGISENCWRSLLDLSSVRKARFAKIGYVKRLSRGLARV